MKSNDASEEVLSRARKGERSAVTDLVEGLRPRVARLAAWYGTRCSEEPGDLEQEALVAILQALPEVRPEVGDPRQYLSKAGKWAMLHYINRQSLRRHEELPEDQDHPVPARAPSYVAAGRLLHQLFERLSNRQAVILRALLAGHTSAEVARLLDCSTANIAWHVGKIREAYRELTAG